ncbi:MAG: hypothetical protein ACM3X9_07905 [Bacillota bacterium]
MKLDKIKAGIVVNVYHIPADRKVPLHFHAGNDEIFHCFAGEWSDILEDLEVPPCDHPPRIS